MPGELWVSEITRKQHLYKRNVLKQRDRAIQSCPRPVGECQEEGPKPSCRHDHWITSTIFKPAESSVEAFAYIMDTQEAEVEDVLS